MVMASKATLCPAMVSAATLASCVALCASIGSPQTSPMAKDVGHVSTLLLVDGNITALVDNDTGALGADVAAVGAAPYSHQHTVEHLLLLLHLALEGGEQSFGPGFEFRHLRIEIDRLVAFLDALGKRADEIAVGARNE